MCTFSRISWHKQANSGIGWSDEGSAKYNEIYDLVESDCPLRGATFNQELLKVHQQRRQKNKKTTEQNVDNERAKSESLATIFKGARSLNVDPPSRSCSNALASLDVGIKTMVISESGRYHNNNMHRKTQINIEMVRSKTNEDNSDIRHQQHNKMIKDIQITVLSQLCGYACL
jgi:hypothetical protein